MYSFFSYQERRNELITPSHRSVFAEHGVLCLEKLIPVELAEDAQAQYFDYCRQKNIRQSGQWLLDEYPITAPINTSAILARELKYRDEFAAVITRDVEAMITELLDGEASFPMTKYPQLLFTLPNSQSWEVPLGPWHVDLPRFPEGEIPGVQVFTFLDHVRPGSGGTLAIAGSHKLLNDGKFRKSKQIARELSKLNYFDDLLTNKNIDRQSLADTIGEVAGTKVKVKELTGEPGDVIFMDMRIVHTIGPNASDIPRAMLTQRHLLERYRDLV